MENIMSEEQRQRGYETAIELLIHEGSLTWNRYNVYLVANSVILASIGILESANNDTLVLSICLTTVGIILCIAWYLLTLRGFDRCNHYYKIAISLENPQVEVLRSPENVSIVSKLGNHRRLSLITICIFFAPYIAFLFI